MIYLPVGAMFMFSLYFYSQYQMLLGSGKVYKIEAFMIRYKVTMILGVIGALVILFYKLA